jgi:hypothetical protein
MESLLVVEREELAHGAIHGALAEEDEAIGALVLDCPNEARRVQVLGRTAGRVVPRGNDVWIGPQLGRVSSVLVGLSDA